MGSHLPFLHRAKQGWKGYPRCPQRALLNSIYVIFWHRVANRNNLPPGLHLSAYVRHAKLNALTLPYRVAAAMPVRLSFQHC